MATRKFLYMDQTEGFSAEQDATDDILLGKLAVSGVGGVGIDAGNVRITNVPDVPTAGTDAVNKNYVDSVATGLDWKESVRVCTVADMSTWTPAGSGPTHTLTAPTNASTFNTIDGVLMSVGQRVLVATAGGDLVTPDADNGIYTVTSLGNDTDTSFVLTRAADADASSEVTAGMATFVSEGTANADKGFVLITNDPITLESTALQYAQFSSTTIYTFNQGLLDSSGAISVELDTDADAQSAGAGGGSSGLEFDVNTASGQLRAAVNGTGGIERTASGLAVKLDGNSLTSSASGVKVGHAPKVQNAINVSEAVAAADPIYISGTDTVGKGDAAVNAKARVIGVALAAQGTIGQPVNIVTAGIAAGILSGATANTPYYLQATGGIGTSLPGAGNRIIEVGVALNTTDLFVRVVDYGKKAA